MKPDVFEIQLDSPNGYYVAGSVVRGQLVIGVRAPVALQSITVTITGDIHTAWVNKTSDKIYESQVSLLNDTQTLNNYLSQVSDGETLPEGTHQIPFQFQLPLSLPSAVFHDSFGSVSYACHAKVELPSESCLAIIAGSSEFGHSIPLTVVERVNLDEYPRTKQPCQRQESVEQVGCCRSQGTVSATLSLRRSGFLIGERIVIELAWKNSSPKRLPQSPSVTLVQQLNFRAQNRYESVLSDEKEAIVAMNSVPVVTRTDSSATLPKSFKGQLYLDVPGDIAPSSAGNAGLVCVSYFLRLETAAFDLTLPIVLGVLGTV